MTDWVNQQAQFKLGGQPATVLSPQIIPAQRQASELSNQFRAASSPEINSIPTQNAPMDDLSAQNDIAISNQKINTGVQPATVMSPQVNPAQRHPQTESQLLKPPLMQAQTAPVRDLNEYLKGAQAPALRSRRMPRTA